MEIIILACLILLNGIFAMSEVAIISVRKTKLSTEVKKGNKRAKAALKLAQNPDSFLSTVQVGITLIGILMGIYSGDVLAGSFSVFLVDMGVPGAYSYTIAQVSIVITVTYFSIIFGELVPKRIGMHFAEKIAKVIARPMEILSKAAYPFVWLLSKSTSLIFNLTGLKKSDSIITEEEIKSMIQESTESGEVQAVERSIVERVFGLGNRTVESIMTYRTEITYIDINCQYQEIIDIIKTKPFSKYPVVNKNSDNIQGILYLKDLFNCNPDEHFSISNYIRPAVYFSEKMKVYSALEEMKGRKIDQGFVIDEYGGLQGLVTLKDILEALVGEIPEIDETPDIVQRKDGSYLVDGQISFYDFLDYFDEEDLFTEHNYSTLSGLILELEMSIPKTGDTISWKNFNFEIVDMDGARIDKILVTKI